MVDGDDEHVVPWRALLHGSPTLDEEPAAAGDASEKLRRCKWKILAIMYFIRRYQAAQRAKDGPNNGKLKSRAQAIIHASRLKQLTAAVSSAANSVVRGSTQGAHGDGAPKPGGLGLQRSKVQTNFGPLPPPDDEEEDEDGGGGDASKS